jgi:hypothetical protein
LIVSIIFGEEENKMFAIRIAQFLLLHWTLFRAAAFQTVPLQHRHQTELFAYRIFSKQRPKVVKDDKTGFYRPVRDTDRYLNDANDSKKNAWDSFKSVVYGSVDGITSLPEKLSFAKKVTTLDQGYVDAKHSPAKRLLREFEKRTVVGDDTVENRNLFDSFKGAVYGTVDTVASAIKRDDVVEPSNELYNLKPAVKVSMANAPEIQQALKDLNSKNTIKQALARRTLLEYERRQIKKQKLLQDRQQLAQTVKEAAYALGDASVATADVLAKVPGQTFNFYQNSVSFLSSLPGQIQKAGDAVLSIPDQITQASNQLKSSITESVETTKAAVQEVRSIPVKVQRNIKETQQSIQNTVEAVDDVAARAKVLIGLKKPKPKPPRSKPPVPLTAKDVAWKITGGVAKGSAQAAWWVGKNVAVLAFQGAKVAVTKGIEAVKGQQAQANLQVASEKQELVLGSIFAKSSSTTKAETKEEEVAKEDAPIEALMESRYSISEPSTRAPLSEKQAKIDRQVANALKLAQEALSMTETLSKKDKK